MTDDPKDKIETEWTPSMTTFVVTVMTALAIVFGVLWLHGLADQDRVRSENRVLRLKLTNANRAVCLAELRGRILSIQDVAEREAAHTSVGEALKCLADIEEPEE